MAKRKTAAGGSTKAAGAATHVFDWLARSPASLPGIVVAFGDEPFLKRIARRALRAVAAGDPTVPPDVSLDGDSAQWRDVADALATQSLFGGGKSLVEVTNADAFISRYRDALEPYPARPFASGALVLDVKFFPANTRFYKAVAADGLAIDCRLPTTGRGKNPPVDDGAVIGWMTAWAKSAHDLKLDRKTAAVVYELVGPQPGLLDQELAKLALYVKPGESPTAELAARVVGGWRTQTAWQMLDHAADGDAAHAMELLGELLAAGDAPQAIFGQVAWWLRRYAAAARAYEEAERSRRKISLAQAMEHAGFFKWKREEFARGEKQLKQLGRQRALALFAWLKETDLKLKSSHSRDNRARLALELLLLRLAKETKELATST